MRRARVYRVLLLLGGTVIGLFLAEVILRVIAAHEPRWLFNEYHDPLWELWFIRAYEGDGRDEVNLHVSHPTRGWVPEPNQTITWNGRTHTTNDRGHRGTEPFVAKPHEYTVLVVGDSFTFGWEAHDSETWPAILGEIEPRLHVLNLGVTGYGVDQMCITLEESIAQYGPQLVVFAYIWDDLNRSLLSFQDYRKPTFVLEGNELRLANTPIGTFSETHRDLRRKYRLPTLVTYCFVRRRIADLFTSSQDRRATTFLLNERIVERAAARTLEQGSEFLLVHLACGEALNDPAYYDQGEDFLTYFTARHDVAHLATRQKFIQTGSDWHVGHYQKPEAELVARAVYERIKSLASWRSFIDSKSKDPPEN